MAARGLLYHIRNYASAGVLSAFAGLISFPIFTRSLSVEQYGILGLTMASLTLFVAMGKLGMQHAVIRFYSQIKAGNISFSLNQMHSSVFASFLFLAIVTTVIWLIMGYFVLPRFLQYENISSLFLVASGLVFVRVLMSAVNNFLRADQQSGVVGIALVMGRYAMVALVLVALLFTSLNPVKIFICFLLADILIFGFMVLKYPLAMVFKGSDFSISLVKNMAVYAVPLMVVESLGLVLRLSDRYLIEAYLGVEELGQYSASYNLVSYLDVIILLSLMQAVKPLYMQLWETKGSAETSQFLSSALHKYLVLGIPFITVFCLTSPHLLNVLASPKYAPGTVVIPFIALSYFVEGTAHFLGAGLYVAKNTRAVMFWGLLTVGVNLVLNIIFIPQYGIVGAAAVTIASLFVFVIGTGWHAFRYVSFPVRIREPLLVALIGAAAYFLVNSIDLGAEVSDFFVKGLLSAAVLLPAVLLIDREVRLWLKQQFALFRDRYI
ncbi:MAG: oligosaccharide flippase family protein [Gammaproteobacteria bacterium]|nr:oligosaccharide flippase family protein [Gammaproteobacteria bacterium]